MNLSVVVLSADHWMRLYAQAIHGEVVYEHASRYVMHEEFGPWSAERPSYFELSMDEGLVRLTQGLPDTTLSLEDAIIAEKVKRTRPGWRSRFRDDSPTWKMYEGHPVAVYSTEDGRRWAALLFRGQSGGVQELLLARDVALQAEQETVEIASMAPPCMRPAPKIRFNESNQLSLTF